MKKYCIFDLDGTLLDTASTITHYCNETLSFFDLPAITEEECITFVGDGPRKLMERMLAYRGVTDQGTVESALGYYISAYDRDPYLKTAPFDGITELLSRLHERGVKVGVVSNKQDSSTKASVSHFLGELVDMTVGSMPGVPLKPSPVSSISLLEKLGGRACECVFVGDSPQDMTTGRAMGAFTVGVSWGFRDGDSLLRAGADRVIDVPNELLEVFKE